MSAYYNEVDAYAAQWLRNLIAAGHIAPGEVDDRSIIDVRPDDLRGFTQAHFFAGIGVWSHALRLAGWSDDRPVWTGSCPCQPFSAAGRGLGTADERHLWPVWFRLIAERGPPVVFGEQVASKAGLGWLDAVHADLEGAGYAVGAADLCAAGVGAPHIRQRLWFVADADHQRREGDGSIRGREPEAAGGGAAGILADAADAGSQGRSGAGQRLDAQRSSTERGGAAGFWSDPYWLPCRDGKARPVEPGTFPLAHGAPARVGRLRAYGNAIVAQVAAAVIGAFMDCRP